jgi:hypothetical protein
MLSFALFASAAMVRVTIHRATNRVRIVCRLPAAH